MFWLSGRGCGLLTSISRAAAVKDKNQQPEQPSFISIKSPCLLAWWSFSLMPRLSIPCLPDSQGAPLPGHSCNSTHSTVTWTTPSVLPIATRPFNLQAWCQEIMWGPASPWLCRVKGWQAPSAHGSGELPAACKTMMGYVGYLSVL